MSARILLEGKLRLVELPMKYAERVGRSKLSVLKDGLRFLTCIVQAAVAYRPARPLLLVAFGLGAIALAERALSDVRGDSRRPARCRDAWRAAGPQAGGGNAQRRRPPRNPAEDRPGSYIHKIGAKLTELIMSCRL